MASRYDGGTMRPITKGVILAGGEGKRLQPVTLEVPKPLITIKKVPLINYNLGLLAKYGANQVKIIIRPDHRKDFKRWLLEYEPKFKTVKIDILEEPEPMGTLGYLFHNLRSWMGKENIYVTNGDDIKNVDLAAMTNLHVRMNLPATVALIEERERTDAGFVLVKENKILNYMEKRRNDSTKYISAGIYILSPQALDAIHRAELHGKKHLMFEADLFPALVKENNLVGFMYDGSLHDCGTFERWARAIREV